MNYEGSDPTYNKYSKGLAQVARDDDVGIDNSGMDASFGMS
jgi:hypothetical protein